MRLRAFWCVFGAFLLTACSSISPDITTPQSGSPGPNGLHSGVYAAMFDKSGAIMAQLWYPETRESYNDLIAKYGSQFVPALKSDSHLTAYGNFWKADQAAISNYINLLNLKRADKTP
jgi:hypothetical protein